MRLPGEVRNVSLSVPSFLSLPTAEQNKENKREATDSASAVFCRVLFLCVGIAGVFQPIMIRVSCSESAPSGCPIPR